MASDGAMNPWMVAAIAFGAGLVLTLAAIGLCFATVPQRRRRNA